MKNVLKTAYFALKTTAILLSKNNVLSCCRFNSIQISGAAYPSLEMSTHIHDASCIY